MYSRIYNPNWNQIFQFRLDAVRQRISQLDFPTKGEYQAAVISELNALIKSQDQMLPLHEITAEAPALVGDVQQNLDTLNEDVRAVSSQLVATEQLAASLLNLYASTQLSLQQRIRQLVYGATRGNFAESFISADLLDSYSADVDMHAGVVALPVAESKTVLPASVRVGVGSSGALLNTSDLAYLVDSLPQTVVEWSGERLELVVEFASNVLINRLKIEPHDCDGLVVEEISVSPDGIWHENVLDELPAERRKIDASSNKFSGDYILDFTPKESRYVKIVLRDCVGAKAIRLRGISFFSRRYVNQGYTNFKPVKLEPGKYRFEASQMVTDRLTRVQHQVSDDGVKFRVIDLESELQSNGTVWYRVFLQRRDDDFPEDDNPFVSGVQDPEGSAAFTMTQTSVTTDLGGGIYRRELPLDSLSGQIRIKDRVVEGTMEVLVNGAPLTSDRFSFSQNILSVRDLALTGVTLRYQTSLAGQVNFNLRKPYFSPFVYETKLTRAL